MRRSLVSLSVLIAAILAMPALYAQEPGLDSFLMSGAAPGSCTKEAAYQTIGRWGRPKPDDLAMADPTFSKAKYKTVLAKAQKAIDLFIEANPEFTGLEAHAYRGIRGRSYLPNGPLPFFAYIAYTSFHCIGPGEGRPEERGNIILFGSYGFTTISFNSLTDVLENAQDGSAFVTAEGDEIFDYKRNLADFKGFTMIEPMARSEDHHEAVIIAPAGRLPYRPVTREEYLLARIKIGSASTLFANDVARMRSMLERLSATERNMPAIVRDINASPATAKLFVTEAEGGKHLVIIDKSFFNTTLLRETIQFITVHWHWNDADTPKALAVRQMKQNLDLAALKQMLGT